MTELIVVRYGETECNAERRFQGHIDAPLNPGGRRQAERIATALQSEGHDIVISSDLLRAKETASAICARVSCSYSTTPGLRGQSLGVFEGRTWEDIEQAYPVHWREWLRFRSDYVIPEGESKNDLFSRAIGTVLKLVTAHIGRRIVLVTHGDVLDMLWRYANELPLNGMRQCKIPNGGINRILVTQPDGTMQIVDWANIEHLSGMPEQPTYDQSRYLTRASV